jgi:DNA-binding PadR family transcriptional regulator
VTVSMSLLALLEDGPTYGLELKKEFEMRTSGLWPINVGQVYATLQRLARDGLVGAEPMRNTTRQKTYRITMRGGVRLRSWLERPTAARAPSRNEMVMKMAFASTLADIDLRVIIQAERRAALHQLRVYLLRKSAVHEAYDQDPGLLLDWLILGAEAQLQWLDVCEAAYTTSLRAAPGTSGITVPGRISIEGDDTP